MTSKMTKLSVETVDHVATVTLTCKTMGPTFFSEIGTVFRGLAEDTTLRAVVIRGAAKPFSYGLDLMEAFQAHGPLLTGANLAGPRMELLALVRRWQADIIAVAALPVPVICAIHGWCVGGGLDLASACDIRLCSADAKFSLRETRIAIVADLGSLQRLPGIIGRGATAELAYTGKDIDANRALQMGLVNSVHADRDAVWAEAEAMAREIASNAPLTVRGVKDVLRYGEGKTVEEGLAYVAVWNSAFVASEDLGEAVSAFMNKREAKYKGA